MTPLMELARRWPVGARLRHQAGWTGTVVVDDPGNPLTLDGRVMSHRLVGGLPVVCVQWAALDGRPAVAWFNPRVLVLAEGPESLRGVITFVTDAGEEKTAYNRFDSYPSGLGVGTLAPGRCRVSPRTLSPRERRAVRLAGDG